MRLSRPLIHGGVLGLLATVAAVALWSGGALTPLERLTWQWRVTAFACPPQTPVVVIALDQQSLDWGARDNALAWPWPREAYVPLLDFCRRSGAKGVAFDLLFSEPSVYGSEDDRALAEALSQLPTAGGAALSRQESRQIAPMPLPPLAVAGTGLAGEGYAGATLPVAELRPGFSRIGNVSASPDSDGIYRRARLLDRLHGNFVAGLPLALYLAVHPATSLRVEPGRLLVGNTVVPLDETGAAILRFRGPAMTFPSYSAAAIIQSELRLREGLAPIIAPRDLQGRYVFFGLTAPGLKDLRATPGDGVFPGVEVQATVLDNLLSGAFLRQPPFVPVLALTLVLATLTGVAVRQSSRVWQTVVVACCGLPLPLVGGAIAYQAGVWLPVALPLAAAAMALTSALLMNYAVEGKQRRFIKRAFNQYLHPTVIEQLVEHPDRLRLGGERRELSIFFSDLQGFTTLSEKLEPEALTALLNEYLTAMTDIILDSGGTIDKYEGDAIIAFWNAPLAQADHAERAVRAALACQACLAKMRPALRARVGTELFMRIGINTGPAVVGNLGSQRRFDYTMLGDAVNLAARLEGVNKEFGTYTLISAATRQQLPGNIALREIGRVGVVGRQEPVQIFEPLFGHGDETSQARFSAALASFYAGEFQAAATAFAVLGGEDRTAAIYAERCRQLAASPPPEWSGVWRLAGK